MSIEEDPQDNESLQSRRNGFLHFVRKKDTLPICHQRIKISIFIITTVVVIWIFLQSEAPLIDRKDLLASRRKQVDTEVFKPNNEKVAGVKEVS